MGELRGGIRCQLRMLISHPPESRYRDTGGEVLQVRGRVIDYDASHPEVVVRFSGQRRSELFRWARPDKHLGVDGYLDVKSWKDKAGQHHVALLIDAVNLFPLAAEDSEPARAGAYALDRESTGGVVTVPAPTLASERIKQMKNLLDRD